MNDRQGENQTTTDKSLWNGVFIGFIAGITAAWIVGDIARSAGLALAVLTEHHTAYRLTAADEQDIANRIAAKLTQEFANGR